MSEPAGRNGVALLRALAVDDEPPALDELAYLLRAAEQVGSVITAGDATEALRVLRDTEVHVVFLDIRMPGLDGLELARVLSRFARPPAIVFVTAHDDRAVDAFDLGAVDYLLKPVRPDRLAETLRRVLTARAAAPAAPRPPAPRQQPADEVIPVELAGRTRMVPRSAVRWVEAQGDYARLHTADGSHLVRVALAATRIVILTTFDLDEYVFEALRVGASGFLVKDTEPVDLLRGIRAVASGDALLSPGVTRRLIEEFASRARAPRPPRVSCRPRCRRGSSASKPRPTMWTVSPANVTEISVPVR